MCVNIILYTDAGAPSSMCKALKSLSTPPVGGFMVTAMQKIAFLLFSLFLIVADQLSKWAVTEHVIRTRIEGAGMPLGFSDWIIDAPEPLSFAQSQILPFFNLVMIWNKGVSFGLFNEHSDYGPMLLTGVSLVITLVFLIVLFRSAVSLHSLGYALIIGGALGNVIDRLRFGAVIDFIDIHAGGYHWPAFNIADSCICVGVVLLVVLGLFFDRQNKEIP
jgi:signal peptidase II